MKHRLAYLSASLLLIFVSVFASCGDDTDETGGSTNPASISATDANGDQIDIVAFASDNSDNEEFVITVKAENADWNARLETIGEDSVADSEWLEMTLDRTGNTITLLPLGNNDDEDAYAARVVIFDTNRVATDVTVIVAQKGTTGSALSVNQANRSLEFAALRRDNTTPTEVYVIAMNIEWDARVDSQADDTADWFEYSVDPEKNLLTVKALGNNLSDEPYKAHIAIYDKAGVENDVIIELTQLNDTEVDLLVNATMQCQAADTETNMGQYAIYAGNEEETSDEVLEGAALYWMDVMYSNVIYSGVNYWDARIPEGTYTVTSEYDVPFTVLEGELRQMQWGNDYTFTWVFRNEMISGAIEMVPYRIVSGTVDVSYADGMCYIYYDFTSEDGSVHRAIYEEEFVQDDFLILTEAPFASRLEGNTTFTATSAAARYTPSYQEWTPGYWTIFLMGEGASYEYSWADNVTGSGPYMKIILYDDKTDGTGEPSTELPVIDPSIETDGVFHCYDYVFQRSFLAGSAPGAWNGTWYWNDAADIFGGIYAPIISGEMVITRSGSNYSIQIAGWDDTWTMRGGQYTVNCTFNGPVTIVTP